MNKKANVGIVGAIILFAFFIINWFMWLGGWIATVGKDAVTSNGLTGLEAFAFSNLNFIVLICLILGMMGFMYFSQ